MAAASNAPVTCMETAGEGGPYGMALLAAYLHNGQGRTLAEFLARDVFAGIPGSVQKPDEEGIIGFRTYLERFRVGLAVERAAVSHL